MKIYFKTFGCKVNQYETELIRSCFREAASVDDPQDADWCIINTCTVTGEADTKCRHMVKKILRDNPVCRIIITGCYAERAANDLKKISPRVEVFSQSKKNEIPAHILKKKIDVYESLHRFHHHTRAFVKIQDGCDSFCSYCIVPYVRSGMWSREVASILDEVKSFLANGYKEIVLTGIRLGKFSRDSVSLSELVRMIIALEGDFRLRLSSLEIQEIDQPLIDMMQQSKKLCRHLHIPLQSGDNDILKRMNRSYTAEEFFDKIVWIKNAVPDIGITTDVLIGYPGETELQFENTFILVNNLEFSRLHVFRFSPRQETRAAAESQTITAREITIRMNVMKVINAILRKRFADRFLGLDCRVLPESQKNGLCSGFTDNYIRVKLSGSGYQNAFINGPLKYSDKLGYSL